MVFFYGSLSGSKGRQSPSAVPRSLVPFLGGGERGSTYDVLHSPTDFIDRRNVKIQRSIYNNFSILCAFDTSYVPTTQM